MALEQGREVFAVPGSPLDPRADGTNDLLKQGAALVTEADDVSPCWHRSSASRSISRSANPISIRRRRQMNPAADERRRVIALLGPTPVEIDDLVRLSGASPAVVRMVLLELEIAGRLERQAGGRVALL